jgi:hypothetical protein
VQIYTELEFFYAHYADLLQVNDDHIEELLIAVIIRKRNVDGIESRWKT